MEKKWMALGLISLIGIKLFLEGKAEKRIISINDVRIEARIAKSATEIKKGLAGVEKLADKEGMLFMMPDRQRHAFWMKGMQFSLDIIWIDNGTVIDVTKKIPVSQNGNLPIYRPKTSANFVLEVNSGFTERYGIKIGDKVTGL